MDKNLPQEVYHLSYHRTWKHVLCLMAVTFYFADYDIGSDRKYPSARSVSVPCSTPSSLKQSYGQQTQESGDANRRCKAQLKECPNIGFGEADKDKILQDGSISVGVIWNWWMYH